MKTTHTHVKVEKGEKYTWKMRRKKTKKIHKKR